MEKMVIPASEAAKLLCTDNHTVQRALERGDIPAYKEGRNWKIPVSLLKATIENRAIAEAKERRKLHEEVQDQSV